MKIDELEKLLFVPFYYLGVLMRSFKNIHKSEGTPFSEEFDSHIMYDICAIQ